MTYVYCFKLHIAIEMFLSIPPTASISSKKIIQAFLFLAISNSSRTIRAPYSSRKNNNKWKSLRKNKSKSFTFIKLCSTTCICWYNDITEIHCMLFWTINRYFESLIPRQHIFAPIPIQSHEWSRHLFYLPPHGHRVFFQSPEVQTTGLLSEARYQGSQNARAET